MENRKVLDLIARVNRNPPPKRLYENPDAQYSKFVVSPYHGASPMKKPHYVFLSRWVQENLAKEESILEVGCGVGLWGEHLRKLGYENYVGVDVNNLLIEIGQRTLDSVELRVMDGRNLKFDDGCFDFVGYVNCFFNYREGDCQRFVNEALRVSRKYVEFDTAYGRDYAVGPIDSEVKEWLGNKLILSQKIQGERHMWVAKK